MPSWDVGTYQYWCAGGVNYESRAFNKIVDVSGLEEEEPILDPAGRELVSAGNPTDSAVPLTAVVESCILPPVV